MLGREKMTVGGGCFWCLEAVFQQVKGVLQVESGYAGGHTDNPDYQAVCSGKTGHAEVVQITYDPAMISFQPLLEIFFAMHDPTTLNRQGADIGTQYRSVIFAHDQEQERIARTYIRELEQSGQWDAPIVTQVFPLPTFYKAEAYHQNYFLNHPDQGYCAVVVGPKVAKFRKTFTNHLNPGAVK